MSRSMQGTHSFSDRLFSAHLCSAEVTLFSASGLKDNTKETNQSRPKQRKVDMHWSETALEINI